ncbi:MAG TPA: hypothetical protein VJ831_03770 [Jatrophihabitantaceae bacterium]|nr:hypothetical protein [Jatrophihabitantaceae bacterium]
MASTPGWRRTVDALDSRVSGRLDGIVHNDNFAIAVGVLLRGQREVKNRVGSATTSVLHAFNLPAKRDLDRLMRHVATLEREVLALSDRTNSPATPAAPTKRKTAARSPRTKAAEDGTA